MHRESSCRSGNAGRGQAELGSPRFLFLRSSLFLNSLKNVTGIFFISNLCLMQCIDRVCTLKKSVSIFRNKLTFFVRLGDHQFQPQEDFHGQLVKMDVRDIRTLSFLVSQGKGFPMRNMRDELTFDPGLGQTGHNGSSKVAGYFNRSSSRWSCQNG